MTLKNVTDFRDIYGLMHIQRFIYKINSSI
jgi:hypothetical protein